MPDLGAVESATWTVASVLRTGDLVVLESTTYPGTTEEVVGPLFQRSPGQRHDHVDHVLIICGSPASVGYSHVLQPRDWKDACQ